MMFKCGCGKSGKGSGKNSSLFPSIPAGELRDRITIQSPSLVPDGRGGGVYNWSSIASAWADVTPVDKFNQGIFSSRELFQQDQLRTRRMFVITMRYGIPVDTTMRVLYKGKDLEIESVINVNEMDWVLILYCKESGKGEP